MEFIQVGKVQFHVDHLKDKRLDECIAFFPHIRAELIKQAWKIANPKGKTKPKTESNN
jgi:hypothetical protein